VREKQDRELEGSSMNRFEGKVVFITGAASGIGRATAERLGAEGARLFCTDVNADGLVETAALVRAANAGAEIETEISDVADPDACAASVQACVARFGRLDVLCNVAGILHMDETHELSLETWERVIRINLTGTFLMCRAALPHLLESKGNIVNLSSTSALKGMPWTAAYAASKGAVLSLTRTLAIEYGKRGLRANNVCPGSIDTPMTGAVVFPEGVDLKLLYRAMALDQARGPETVASVIAMLASEDGAHINGESVRVDGATLS